MLRRLSILALAVLFVVGLTAQLIPHASAAPMAGMGGQTAPCEMETTADSAAHGHHSHSSHETPATGKLVPLVNCLGCAVAVDLAIPASAAVSADWISINYVAPVAALHGLTLKPEISPPILFV